MSHNTDNPAFPIIEFLKAEIKVAEERKEFFLSKQMIDSYKMANHFKIAYEEVLKFIEETFEDEAPTEPQPYYGAPDSPYEVIKVIEAWGLDKDAYLFNVIKYVARAGKKDPATELEDLKKAAYYLQRKIDNYGK